MGPRMRNGSYEPPHTCVLMVLGVWPGPPDHMPGEGSAGPEELRKRPQRKEAPFVLLGVERLGLCRWQEA